MTVQQSKLIDLIWNIDLIRGFLDAYCQVMLVCFCLGKIRKLFVVQNDNNNEIDEIDFSSTTHQMYVLHIYYTAWNISSVRNHYYYQIQDASKK